MSKNYDGSETDIHEIRESAREYQSNEDSDEEFTEIYVWGSNILQLIMIDDFYG